ncbi:similar to Saccharomyces cerevisiae YPR073C LTP1 Protein phosphotyrosine phosphatase of unknown cellular role [Maudiozyma barnettii]|uniref:Phosphotyrosine protein phosphatase I domain-containing protein n=1 Tax=Maudiozyma barnettii TaxID=61262 RepID=A0A8H2ZIH5_9SACH|nr:tyrosine protein phosphatase LTP1 [Kazachstania barnettii]CAB4253074.1 similar to Saccharomyces cerevisiae YPR073C LTP1 Protein phosphotyrosine phosphatase of unknown cellular role [Kazachstania barnettii]CAD1780391.1 similar to Saccharomyces cerevisiae YPR073C LTP1 Protein phosphotyrosine phosphatase of unknown cellular role [Kazachstania barnettii]
MTQDKKISVAFICLGNYCRSPMAEAVFHHTVKQNNVEDCFDVIDSFATSNYHVGNTPDSRTVSTCKKYGIPIDHRGQQIKTTTFDKFDYIIGMDEMNMKNLKKIQPKGSKAKLCLFGEWNTDGKFDTIVEDPYYGGDEGFDYNMKQIAYFSEQFLKKEL